MDDLSIASEFAGLVRRLHQAHRLLKGWLAERLADSELSETDFLILGACRRLGDAGLAQGSLAGLVGLSPAQLSSVVERLRQRGWLEVRRSESDRRRQFLRLSPLGFDHLAESDRRIADGGLATGLGWTAEQRRRLAADLDSLIAGCDQGGSAPDADRLDSDPSDSQRGAAA